MLLVTNYYAAWSLKQWSRESGKRNFLAGCFCFDPKLTNTYMRQGFRTCRVLMIHNILNSSDCLGTTKNNTILSRALLVSLSLII
jgi:hypothetical protein